MDACGEWEDETGMEVHTEGNIRHQFQGEGARPGLLRCRNGLEGGICSRLAADDCFSGRAISNEVQFGLDAMLSHGGFPAYELVLGPDPTDL